MAIYTFPKPADLDAYWLDRVGRIKPTPDETEDACANGAGGRKRWTNGEIACYVQDGIAKIRWTDERSGMYGVVDATNADLQRLVRWWSNNARDLGRASVGTGDGEGSEEEGSEEEGVEGPEPTPFACTRSDEVSDPLDRGWTVTQLRFERTGATERVLFDLEPRGAAATNSSTVQVDLGPANDPSLLADFDVDPPEGGDTAIVLRFGPGLQDATGFLHFTPDGTETIKDVSTYRTRGGLSIAVIGVSGDGCYRLAIPAFELPDEMAQSALIDLEIQP